MRRGKEWKGALVVGGRLVITMHKEDYKEDDYK